MSTVVLLAMAGLRNTARADEPGALTEDKRPNAALAACASGDVAKGIAILGELYAETRNPSFVFNQARCFQKNAQLEQARSSFTEYLRIGTNEPPEDIKRAEAFVKEIDDTLARQRASAPPPVVVTPVQTANERARTMRIASIALGAFGLAAVGAGVFLSFKVQGVNDDINRDLAGQEYVTDVERLNRQLSDGQRYETWQWVGYGVGVAALAGAATTFVLGGGFHGPSAGPERAAIAVTPVVSTGGMGGVVQMRF